MNLFGIKKLKEDVKFLKEKVEIHNTRLKVLECEHKDTVLKVDCSYNCIVYREKCAICGKTLKVFTEVEFHREELKQAEKQVKELKLLLNKKGVKIND